MQLWRNFFKGADSFCGENLLAFLPFSCPGCIYNGWSCGTYLGTRDELKDRRSHVVRMAERKGWPLIPDDFVELSHE